MAGVSFVSRHFSFVFNILSLYSIYISHFILYFFAFYNTSFAIQEKYDVYIPFRWKCMQHTCKIIQYKRTHNGNRKIYHIQMETVKAYNMNRKVNNTDRNYGKDCTLQRMACLFLIS